VGIMVTGVQSVQVMYNIEVSDLIAAGALRDGCHKALHLSTGGDRWSSLMLLQRNTVGTNRPRIGRLDGSALELLIRYRTYVIDTPT